MRTSIGVVVLGYRNETSIIDAVDSIVAQRPAPQSVVVVTSGQDASAAIVAERHPEVLFVHSDERLMPGGARNLGIELLDDDVVAFLAADCRARPGWIAGRLAAHGAGPDVVASAMAPPDGVVPFASYLLKFAHRLPTRTPGELRWPDAGAHGASYSRRALDAIGEFDPTVRGGEDTFANGLLADRGFTLWFEPRVITEHDEPTSLRALIADQRMRGSRHQLATGAIDRGRRRRAMARVWWRTVAPVLRTGWRDGGPMRWRVVVSSPAVAVAACAQVTARFDAARAQT